MMNESIYIQNIKTLGYDYIEDDHLSLVYREAKNEILYALYGNDDSHDEIPRSLETRVLRGMQEIILSGNMAHLTSYRENGVSWTKPNSGWQFTKDIISYAQ